jgi:hypothetical protein
MVVFGSDQRKCAFSTSVKSKHLPITSKQSFTFSFGCVAEVMRSASVLN